MRCSRGILHESLEPDRNVIARAGCCDLLSRDEPACLPFAERLPDDVAIRFARHAEINDGAHRGRHRVAALADDFARRKCGGTVMSSREGFVSDSSLIRRAVRCEYTPSAYRAA